jgi:polar amino acid transport system substrate-binding protein
MRRGVKVAAVVVGVAALAAASGCGVTNTEGAGGPIAASFTASEDAAIAAEVPEDIRSEGTFTVASDATYAPDEFMASDGETVIGLDADLAKAIAGVMGLEASIENVPFDSIIPGLAAGKYDVGMSSFTDTKARERVVDFVTYAKAGESFFVEASGGPEIRSLDDLCGHAVGAAKGTTEADHAAAQSEKCTAAGEPPVDVSVFTDQSGVNLALSSSRVEVGFADTPVATYVVHQSDGRFEVSGPSIANAPYGIAIPKDSGMARPVLAAVKALMADGTYRKILEYWGLEAMAISNPTINGAGR